MGLYLVSEQLNVSNSYLSTAFKNAYGVSLVQYLTRLRVEHAKKLILEPPHEHQGDRTGFRFFQRHQFHSCVQEAGKHYSVHAAQKAAGRARTCLSAASLSTKKV